MARAMPMSPEVKVRFPQRERKMPPADHSASYHKAWYPGTATEPELRDNDPRDSRVKTLGYLQYQDAIGQVSGDSPECKVRREVQPLE